MPIYKMNGSKDGKSKYRVRINYVDSYGTNRQIDRVAYGAAEAKDLERKLNYEVKHKSQSQSMGMTVGELYSEYMAARKGEVRESTLRRTNAMFIHHIIPFLGDIKIEKLNAPILTKWKAEINEQGAMGTKAQERLQLKTKQNIYSELRAMLNYAVKMEYIPSNPLTKVGNFKDSTTVKKEMQYYTAEEFKRFIAAAREYAQNSHTMAAWDYYVL